MNYSLFNSSRALMDYIDPDTYGLIISYEKSTDGLWVVIGFTGVKAACCRIGDLNAKVACFPISSLYDNRSNHIFWDLFYPTEIAPKFLTTTFFKGSLSYVHPINVKQLSGVSNKDVFLSYKGPKNLGSIEMTNN